MLIPTHYGALVNKNVVGHVYQLRHIKATRIYHL